MEWNGIDFAVAKSFLVFSFSEIIVQTEVQLDIDGVVLLNWLYVSLK